MSEWGDDIDFDDFAVGIDLGTTNTVLSYMSGGKLELVRNESGGFLHPSVVGFMPSGAKVVGRSLFRVVYAVLDACF